MIRKHDLPTSSDLGEQPKMKQQPQCEHNVPFWALPPAKNGGVSFRARCCMEQLLDPTGSNGPILWFIDFHLFLPLYLRIFLRVSREHGKAAIHHVPC